MRTHSNSHFILAATLCLALAVTGISWLALKADTAQASTSHSVTPLSTALVAEPQALTARLLVNVSGVSGVVTQDELPRAATQTGAAWLLLIAVVCLPLLSILSGFKVRRKPIHS